MVIFYEQSQRWCNLLTQMWCLICLSEGFEFSSDEWNLCSFAHNFRWLHKRLFTFILLPWIFIGDPVPHIHGRMKNSIHWFTVFDIPPPLHKNKHSSRIYLPAIHRITFISMNLLYVQNIQNHKKKNFAFHCWYSHMSIHICRTPYVMQQSWAVYKI